MTKLLLADHCGNVWNGETDKATGTHFHLPGHTLKDNTVLEQTRGQNSA